MLRKIVNLILGEHPKNTCFSFNWHNVRHINRFLAVWASQIKQRDLSIADIGGGKSPYYSLFSDYAAKYVVVDMKEVLPKNESRHIVQIPGCGEDIPLDDSSTDLVLCNQVLEHVVNPEQSTSEMYRILRPGGLCLGSVPHLSPIHLEPHDYRRYTRFGLERLLEGEGFCEIHVEGSGGVFSAAAFMVLMDLFLSRMRQGAPQRFHACSSVIFFPIVGIVNLTALFADKVFGDRLRTPSNLCWSAVKPSV